MTAKNILSPETLCLCRLMGDDETILWQGKPQWDEIIKYRILAGISIIIGIALCILANFIVIVTFQIMGIYIQTYLDLFLITLPLFIVYFIFASLTASVYNNFTKLNDTDYFITPSKIIEMEVKERTNKIFCINLSEISEIETNYDENNKKKTQNVTFYSSELKRFDNKINKWVSTDLRKSYINFKHIQKDKVVYNILNKLIPDKIPSGILK